MTVLSHHTAGLADGLAVPEQAFVHASSTAGRFTPAAIRYAPTTAATPTFTSPAGSPTRLVWEDLNPFDADDTARRLLAVLVARRPR